MTRDEYLRDLKLALQQDGFEQVEEAVAWFDEMLQDRMADGGKGEEEAVSAMEPPQSVARSLREGAAKERGKAEKAQAAQGETAGAQERQGGAEAFTGVKVIRFKADQARHIRVRDRNTGIIVTGVSGDEIVLRHPQSERIRYDFTLEDGRMSLVRQPWDFSQGLFYLGFLSREMSQVTLEVPRELAAELDLSTSNSAIRIGGVQCWGQLKAASSNGSLALSDVSAKTIDLKTANARVTLERVQSGGALSAVTSNARAEAKDTQAKGPLTLKTSNSSAHARGVMAPSVSLLTSNGGIEVEGIRAPEVTLSTSNSAVKGTLPGSVADWDVTSQTSNGKNSLPSRKAGGANKLNVRTSNGSIKLEFAGDAGKGE